MLVPFVLDSHDFIHCCYSDYLIGIILTPSDANLSLLNRGPRISFRSKVNDSLVTGIAIIDSLFPIGRGQRQLILGDRSTGKTSLYLTSIFNTNRINPLLAPEGFGSKRIFHIYCGICLSLTQFNYINNLIEPFEKTAMSISTQAGSPVMNSYLSPLDGVAMGESMRSKGYDVTICFDDLIKHAKSYRQLALSLATTPSRDAYPADVFNLHSDLLERCGKLSLLLGGGSLTGFPIAETLNGNVSDFIITNLISITDGQIYTDVNSFKNGIRPAINLNLSVSRIGSNAQCMILERLSAGLLNTITANAFNVEYIKHINILFYQDHLHARSLEDTVILLLIEREGYLLTSVEELERLFTLIKKEYIELYFLIHLIKNSLTDRNFNWLTKAFKECLAHFLNQ